MVWQIYFVLCSTGDPDPDNYNPILRLKEVCTDIPARAEPPPPVQEPAVSSSSAVKHVGNTSSSMEKPMVTFTTEKPALPGRGEVGRRGRVGVTGFFLLHLLGTVEFTSAEYFDVYVTYINNPISFYLHRIGEGYSVRQTTSVCKEFPPEFPPCFSLPTLSLSA